MTDSKTEEFIQRFGYNRDNNYNRSYSFGPTHEHDNDKYGVGSSKFKLVTYTQQKTSIISHSCVGLLSELPEISFTINYQEGPGKTTQDFISKFFNNPLFTAVNAIGSPDSSFKNMIGVGVLSRVMYAGMANSDIPLKFRIYKSDSLGQSSVESWLKILSNYAVPSNENELTVNNAMTNIIAAMSSAEDTGKELVNIFKSPKDDNQSTDEINNNDNDNETPKQTKQEQRNTIDFRETFASFFEEEFNNKSTELNDIKFIQPGLANKVSFSANYQTVNNNEKVIKITIKYTSEVVDLENPSEKTEKIYEPYILFKIATIGKTSDTNAYVFIVNGGLNPDLSINEDEFSNIIDKTGTLSEPGKTKLKDIVNDIIGRFKNEKLPLITEKASNNTAVKKLTEKFEQAKKALNNVQKIAEHRFGFYRSIGNANLNNMLGEKLWELYIYNNFWLKQDTPLIVCIKNWDIKYSKECVGGIPVYADITISCALDQTYSIEQWRNILTDQYITN